VRRGVAAHSKIMSRPTRAPTPFMWIASRHACPLESRTFRSSEPPL